MKFSFVILTWNRKRFVEKCLSSLLESVAGLEDTEIIVMDNGSTDGTQEFLDSYRNTKNFHVIKLTENFGLNSYKQLINTAKGEYIVVVYNEPQNLDR